MTQATPSARLESLPRRRGGIGLGRLFGIEIWMDWSLAIIFALITTDLAIAAFPAWHPEWSGVTHWTMALAAALLFFASVLTHELSHAVVGRAQGIPIRRITLFLFGGMAEMERRPATPKAELLMAGVGPLVSLAIGVIATAGGVWLSGLGYETLEHPAKAISAMGPVATLLLWLGPVNILLGAFNLVPGFPLDGGRVLRATLWAVLGDVKKATRLASLAGQCFAIVLIALGVMSLLGGAWIQGGWLALIGWFLHRAARSSYESLVVREALREVPVDVLMRRAPVSVSSDTTLESLVQDRLLQTDDSSYLVRDESGTPVGVVGLAQLHRVPWNRWSEVTVGEAMLSIDALPTLASGAGTDRALEALAREGAEQLAVEKEGTLLGIVRRRDILRWLSLQPQLVSS